jgi:hypothetical protein
MIILRIYTALLIAASPAVFSQTENYPVDSPKLPGCVDSLYMKINAIDKIDFTVKDLLDYSSFRETKSIPLSLHILNSQIRSAVKNKNYFVIQYEPASDFFSDSHDIQIWNILFDQVASLREKKLLESGVINMGLAVYYLQLTYTENDNRIRATYSMAIRDRYLIEIIHLENAVKRYPRLRRSASLYNPVAK